MDAIASESCIIDVTAKISEELTPDNEFDSGPIVIALDSDGTLTATCESEISELSTELEIDSEEIINVISDTIDDLKEIAVSVTAGKIGFKFGVDEGYPKLTFIVTSDDIFPDSDSVDQKITVEISFKIIPFPLSSGSSYEINWEEVTVCTIPKNGEYSWRLYWLWYGE